jgi:Na+/proline symporter
MDMLGISGWDWISVIAYFVLITGLGVWSARRVSNTSDFFMAGNRFGKTFMVFFSFGAGTSGNDAVGVSSKTYTNGLSGIWYQWLWLFCTPFYWLIPPVLRRMRALTTGDYFEARYDGTVAALYTVVGVIQLTVNIGVIQLGASSMIEAVTGGAINKHWAVLGMTVMFVIYGMAGGLGAAIITDFIQGILTVALSFMLLPFALHAVGGFTGLHEKIADPHMFSLVAPGEINAFHVVILCVNALIGVVTQPHIMGNCAAGRTEMDGRVGLAGGNLLKRFCTVAWMVVGLCGVVMYPGLIGRGPDQVYGNVARDLLPMVMPGLVGVFLAALLASVMSSCDAFMVSCSGLFTQNLYRRYLVRNRDEKHYLLVGRIAALVIVICGIYFAFTVTNVPRGLEVFFALQAMMGAAFWLGLFWRRTTVAGAWAGTLISFSIYLVTSSVWFNAWAVGHLPEYMIWAGKFRLSWQMFLYLTAGFGSGILVSLVTPRVSSEKLDRVYACLRTPIRAGEKHVAPFTLPEGVTPPPPRKLINHPDLEIPMPTLVGMAGFAFFAVWVVLLVGFVFWMSGWGARPA